MQQGGKRERQVLPRESRGEKNPGSSNHCTQITNRKTEPCIFFPSKGEKVRAACYNSRQGIRSTSSQTKRQQKWKAGVWVPGKLQRLTDTFRNLEISKRILKRWYGSNCSEFSLSFYKVKNHDVFKEYYFCTHQIFIHLYTHQDFKVFLENEIYSYVQMYLWKPLRGKTISALIKQVFPLLDVFHLLFPTWNPYHNWLLISSWYPWIFRRREWCRPASALGSSTAQCLPCWNAARQCSGKTGICLGQWHHSCHHCCVTLNYSHQRQLIPHWCQAGAAQLLWELWFIHFAKSRQAKQSSEGSQVTWTLLP